MSDERIPELSWGLDDPLMVPTNQADVVAALLGDGYERHDLPVRAPVVVAPARPAVARNGRADRKAKRKAARAARRLNR